MNKKVCVYAIAKNEIKFVDRWYESVKEADFVCVLDTGSMDGTFERFKELGVITKQKKYKKFRFDKARNDSLELVPEDTDICVCVDIDEYFEKGWCKILKENWTENTGRARYRYTWNFNPDGSEGYVFMADKMHKKGAFIWTHPVHEILTQIDNNVYDTITLPGVQLNHKADNTKSRASYLPLLELSLKERPNDDRNAHYLGREYMFNREYDKAIETLKYHLALPTATWAEERCASLRFIALCYKYKGLYNLAEEYFLKAILECNYTREVYFELALLYYEEKEFLKCAVTFEEMFKIKERALTYISSPVCWGSLPYDYLSLAYYNIGEYSKALTNVEEAIKLSDDERLKNNKQAFLNLLNTKN